MPRIQKKSPLQNLTRYQTFIVDTTPLSQYFKISELSDTLTAGKNGFLIEGSTYLAPTTEIKIEILDTEGEPLYVEPGDGLPEYYEGVSKLISTHVYQSTPIGIGKITILGELQTYIDENGVEQEVPVEWRGIYNVKWERDIKINKGIANESRVRFIQRPSIIIEEIGDPFYTITDSILEQTNGTVRGYALTPEIGRYIPTYRGGIQYLIQNESQDFVDGISKITVSGSNIVDAEVIDYMNQRSVIVSVPYTGSDGTIQNFGGLNYTASYDSILSIAPSDRFGSFARFEINNLATFVGDVERIKIYGKSRAFASNYTLLYDVRVDSTDLLTDVISGSIESVGYFSSSYFGAKSYTDYWMTQSSTDISLDSSVVYKGIKFRNNGVSSMLGDNIRLEKGSEYTVTFWMAYTASIVDPTDTLKVYTTSTLRTPPGIANYYLTQSIASLTAKPQYLHPQKLTYNFIADQTDDWTLNIEARNKAADSNWYVGSVTLEGSNELGYSPDEFTFTIPFDRTLSTETFDLRFEYYDINNNYIPIYSQAVKTFVSGNLTLVAKNLSIDPDKYFFTFNQDSAADPDPQVINIFGSKTNIAGNLLITSQAYDSGGFELLPAVFLGTPFPGRLTNVYEDLISYSASLLISDFTASLHGSPPGPGNVIVDRILYTVTEPNSPQPIVKRVSISRVLTNNGTGSNGAPGSDAKVVTLTSNIYAIPYDSDGNEIGTNNIYLTASQQNHLGVVYYEFQKNGVTKQNDAFEYYYISQSEKPVSPNRDSYKVLTREGSPVGTVIAFDTVDIFALKDGVNGYTVFLTNESHTYPADEDGVISSVNLGNGFTDVQFYRGTTQYTYDNTLPYGTNTYREGTIVATPEITYATSTVAGDLRITPTAITTNAGATLSGSITVPLIDNATGLSFPKVYSYTVSKAGRSGSNAVSVILNPSTQVVSKSFSGTSYNTPVKYDVRVIEKGTNLTYSTTLPLPNSYFTIYLPTGEGTNLSVTGNKSGSIQPSAITTDNGVTSSFAIQYRDSKGVLSEYISQSHFVTVVKDGKEGINAVNVRLTPETQVVSRSFLGTYSERKEYQVQVIEAGSAMTYRDNVTPLGNSEFTIWIRPTEGTNTSNPGEVSASILPVQPTTTNGDTSSFAVQYRDSTGVLSEYVSQSHYITVVSDGATGPGVILTGLWQPNRTYQFSTGDAGRKEVVLWSGSVSSFDPPAYYITNRTHTSVDANAPDGPPLAPLSTAWTSLGTQDYFVAAKIGLFEDSFIKNTLNIGSNDNGQVSSANITLNGIGQYPYMSMGQSSTVGQQKYAAGDGIFLGRDTDGQFKLSVESVNSGNGLLWDGTSLLISGTINAEEGFIGDWIIDRPDLRDVNRKIILNPTTPEIYFNTDAGQKKLSIRSGSFTNPTATPVTIAIDPPISTVIGGTYTDTQISSGLIFNSTTPYAFATVTRTGTYFVNTPNWGTATGNFIKWTTAGRPTLRVNIYVDVYNTTDRSGPLVKRMTIASSAITGDNTFRGITYNTNAQSIVLQAGLTYYAHLTVSIQGTILSSNNAVEIITTNINPASQTFTLDLDITELTTDGLVIASDTSNYTIIRRSNSNTTPNLQVRGGVNFGGSYAWLTGENATIRINSIGTSTTSTDKAVSIGQYGLVEVDHTTNTGGRFVIKADGKSIFGSGSQNTLFIDPFATTSTPSGRVAIGTLNPATASLTISSSYTAGTRTFIAFQLNNVNQGSINTTNGSIINYSTFLGSHWAQMNDNSRPDILYGTVMETVNDLCEWPGENNEHLPKVKISDTLLSTSVYGVFLGWDTDWLATNDMYIGALGAAQIRINSGSIVKRGDYLMSAGNGTAIPQSDTILHSYTIAKVTSEKIINIYDDGTYIVPCTLHCG